MTTITVVIPSRDDARLLERCLAALAAGHRRPDEVVVVDNGSADDTAEVARAAGARVVSEPVAGIPRAAAAGYDAAWGEVIARLDADSVPPADWLSRVVAAFDRDPEMAMLTGMGEFYDVGRVAARLGRAWYLGGLYWAMTPYLGHAPLFGSNFAMRRGVWQELCGEVHRTHPRIHDDLDLSLHVKPWMDVVYDPALVVAVSGRPFHSASGLTRRLSWVLPTLRLHWPEDAPWRRRRERRRWRERPAARSAHR